MKLKHKSDFKPRSTREIEIQKRVLATISLMRRERLPLKIAAKVERIRPATVVRYAGSALRKSKSDYRVKPSDRIPRSLNVIGPKGMRIARVRGSKSATTLARYMNAVKTFVRTGNPTPLERFKGERLPGSTQNFVVSPKKLKLFADAGILEIEKLYVGPKEF
jgi:hypothetical protein